MEGCTTSQSIIYITIPDFLILVLQYVLITVEPRLFELIRASCGSNNRNFKWFYIIKLKSLNYIRI